MALVYRDQGDYEKALKYFEKALDICTGKLGLNHPNTIVVKENLDDLKQFLSS